MTVFHIKYQDKVQKDVKKHQKSGNKIYLNKIDELFNELRVRPKTGTGKPEQLKYYKIPTYSRRISEKHRLVYEVIEEDLIVNILSVWGHYDDK
jgi:toxin YoeB